MREGVLRVAVRGGLSRVKRRLLLREKEESDYEREEGRDDGIERGTFSASWSGQLLRDHDFSAKVSRRRKESISRYSSCKATTGGRSDVMV